jgi:hypothetical protein
VDKQSFEHRLDVARLPEPSLDARTPTVGEGNDEIPRTDVTELLAVEDERNPRHEVRLADDELAALRNLDDDRVGQLAPLPAIVRAFLAVPGAAMRRPRLRRYVLISTRPASLPGGPGQSPETRDHHRERR